MKFSNCGSRSEYFINNFGEDFEEFVWERSYIYVGPRPYPYYLQALTPREGYELYFYGFSITSTEQNEYFIIWSSKGEHNQLYIPCGSCGTLLYTSKVAINGGCPVGYKDYVYLICTNPTGTDKLYQTGLLVGVKKIE